LTDHSNIAKVGCCLADPISTLRVGSRDPDSQDIAKAMNVADARARMEQQGAVPLTTTPEQFDVIIRNDAERNVRVLWEAGVAAN